jgi:hypothetical protein
MGTNSRGAGVRVLRGRGEGERGIGDALTAGWVWVAGVSVGGAVTWLVLLASGENAGVLAAGAALRQADALVISSRLKAAARQRSLLMV